MELDTVICGYGNMMVESFSPPVFIDASIYLTVDESGQPALYREKDALRFVLMAAMAHQSETAQVFLSGKKILDVGCGGGQISHCMQNFSASIWLCDPDLANIKNPANRMFDKRYCIDLDIQKTLELLPELHNFFDLVTSFAPHPFPLMSEPQSEVCKAYYESMIKACRPGGDIVIMPIYEHDLGLADGFMGIWNLLAMNFSEVSFRKVSMEKPSKAKPFFSTFIVAKNKCKKTPTVL